MKREFLAPTSNLQPPIQPDDDIDVAIIKVLETYRKGFTTDEMYKLLEHKVDDPEAIKPTMFMLNAKGWFNTQYIAGDAVYSLRNGRTHKSLGSEPNRPTAVRKAKQPEQVATVDPASRILLSEGIDVAIWKSMRDYKWRSVVQIIEIVTAFGFDKFKVRRRVDALIRTNRWFDRTGKGRITVYSLKTGLKCPTRNTDNEPTAHFDSEPECAAAVVEATQPQPVDDTAVPESPEVVEPVETEAPKVQVTTARQVEISHDDHVKTAVWKVMLDGEEYTASDVALLLLDYGFRATQVKPVLSIFHQEGYVTRRPIPATSAYKPVQFTYRLKDVTAPIPKFKTRDSRGGRSPHIADPEFPVNYSAPEPVEKDMTKPNLLQPLQPEPSKAPLISVQIQLRGQTITLEEFDQLYGELCKAKFDQVGRPESLLEASYKIKGVTFTVSELYELVGKMGELGAAFSQAVIKT